MTEASRIRWARSLRRNETAAEYRLWYELRNNRLNGYKFVRQFPIGPFFADFACRSNHLVVELDGSQHATSSNDERRSAYLNDQGWSVLRFWNEEIFRERTAVCETIQAVLDGRITERCNGAGLVDGLRFAPGTPSPASLGSTPSPGSGEGKAPFSANHETAT